MRGGATQWGSSAPVLKPRAVAFRGGDELGGGARRGRQGAERVHWGRLQAAAPGNGGARPSGKGRAGRVVTQLGSGSME
jgi:hypothetical protein